ncbi:hypothetical protein B0H17DRAFT_1064721 [Mycena rosella]|uniref:Protein prenylyltransferase n=1 Tax=Mycena rosella TaxID=1033263 RepID=A0AAD7DG38_MYCRO|nr:hypothetical protein B0H17DRAFT_1064721 [Mycena rosella]
MANPLVHTLGKLLMQRSPLSVEIIPGGIEQWLAEPPGTAQPSTAFPFLHMDGHLGVPQKTLYQLYLSALALLGTETNSVTSQIDASCVILLANPAHQTALNVRKRLVQAGTLSAHEELDFSARLLASSRPASKESTQWAHRRWIFCRLYPRTSSPPDFGMSSQGWTPGGLSEFPEIPPDVIEAEFKLISRCCETYPRNYHAWSHHHLIMQYIYISLRCFHPADTPYLPLFVGEYMDLRRWIETHISDYSAMHRFCTIASRLQSLDLPQYDSTLRQLADPVVLFDHALTLVKAFPTHESLWMYLRAVITISPQNANSFAASAISSTAHSPFRDRFISWAQRYYKLA